MMYEELYEKAVNALVKDGYIVIDNALSSELASALYEEAKAKDNFKRAGISKSSELHVDNNRRRDKISWLDRSVHVENQFLEFSDGLREYINIELFLGLSYYEAHFAIYEKGDFYERHLDSFKNFKNRVVTTVYYLNEDFKESDGGELVVYDKENNFLSKIAPKSNRLIIFMSEKFPHEVLPTKKRRYSIAGWFRVDIKTIL